tara:strand:- start:1541 stop:1990 length:450 start_codon:yes stop_codon:yes gene_type:complete
MSAVIQMPPAIDASIRACCTEAVQQAVAVLAAKYKFDAEEAERELKLDELKLERKRGPAPKTVEAAAKSSKAKADKADKPKKAKTGYLLFSDSVRADVKAELLAEKKDDEKLKGSDVISGCAAKWKELSKEEQVKWNERAKALSDSDSE